MFDNLIEAKESGKARNIGILAMPTWNGGFFGGTQHYEGGGAFYC